LKLKLKLIFNVEYVRGNGKFDANDHAEVTVAARRSYNDILKRMCTNEVK